MSANKKFVSVNSNRTIKKRILFLLYFCSALISATTASDNSDSSESYLWNLGAGAATVNSQYHALFNGTANLPLWKLDASFELELFLGPDGKVSKKTWNFDSGKDIAKSLLRKINYIRFVQPDNPFSIALGNIDPLTFGNGFVVDRFTNKIHLPDIKHFGLKVSLREISAIDLSLDGFIADVMDFTNDGGIIGGHIAFKPFAPVKKKVLRGMEIHGIFATDLNLFAPAREWEFVLRGDRTDRDEDGILDGDYLELLNVILYNDSLTDEERQQLIAAGEYDTLIAHKDQWARDSIVRMTIAGGEVIVPVITKEKYRLSLYGQCAVTLDDRDKSKSAYKGWGIGFPGIQYNYSNAFIGSIEYRHCEGTFQPHFFNRYYLAERVLRYPVRNKTDRISGEDLNGLYTRMTFSPKDFVTVDCRYNFLLGGKKESGSREKDISFEGTFSLNPALLRHLPVSINNLEIFYYQAAINSDKKQTSFFHRSPEAYWGFYLNWELFPHVFLEALTLYGWQWKDASQNELVKNNTLSWIAGVRF